MNIKKKVIDLAVFILPLLIAAVCLFTVSFHNTQSSLPLPMPQEFIGEYSYDRENWQPLTESAELSAMQGDLFLRGHFLREMQEGWHLTFYRNHIGVSMYLNGEPIYRDTVSENPGLDARQFASMCARDWRSFVCPHITAEDTLEIVLHNPHICGNKTAYRDFLTTLCVDTPEWNLLEKNLSAHGEPSRIAGGLLSIASLMLLGAAIAAAAVRIPVGETLLNRGLLTLFAGGFIVFDTVDVSFWSELNIINTYTGQLCMMMAVFCFDRAVGEIFSGLLRKIAKAAVLASAVLNSILMVLSFTGVTVIFDTLPYWLASQLVLCPLLAVLCLLQLRREPKKPLLPVSALLLFAAILADMTGFGQTIVWRCPLTKLVFILIFAVHIIFGARDIVINHRASVRAAKLEKELEDSRIAVMLSQIKPHFLYNVLNAIYHLYRKEPETAQEAVSSFAEYLRCNMLSIEKSEPIPFSEEYRHIQTYLSLEQIRFRGKLDVVYDVEVTDFRLPALTVEPLVENAVKHGVIKKRGGGIVTISTRSTEEGYLVTVADTGVGFDPENYMQDGKPHVGIRNVRERLQNLVGGSLSISSSSAGTVAAVFIPAKEARKNEDHRSR